VGSLSGGCIEEELIRKLTIASKADESVSSPFLYDYEISGDDQQRYSLPCGGQLRVLVEYLIPDEGTLQHFSSLLGELNRRQCVAREVSIGTGHMALVTNMSVMDTPVQLMNDSVITRFGPTFKMLLLGAGEVSRYVAQIANTVDFSVTICDPRESYLQGFEVDGVRVMHCLPDDLVREEFSDKYCAILALAHDPRVDDMALMEALKTKAFYIGAMGSSRTTEARLARLSSLGCSAEEIEQLHAPIGFDIGSKKPAEIAISIMAQVLAERHQCFTSKLGS
jgi:xanthine dehydrogenase accessory factor